MNQEINNLIKKAKKYLKSSELLINSGDYESSVSRTYYAMFYCAEAVLLTKNLSFSSHKGVISAFGEHFIKSEIFPKELAKELHSAFEKRQLGDYQSSPVFQKEEAVELLENGNNFLQSVKKYLASNMK